MPSRLRRSLKRIKFVVGVRMTLRGALLDLKTLSWRISRGRKVSHYMSSHRIRKLQIGTSRSPINGWLNSDLTPKHRNIVYLDATKRFPFCDNVFDYIACEHMIEHITYENASSMLRECFRVLKPRGRIRIATPDLGVLIGLYGEKPENVAKKFVEFAIARYLPSVQTCKEVFVINNAFRAWGHTFLYDRPTLQTILTSAGFEGIEFYKSGASGDEELRNLEKHGEVIGSEEMNRFVTVVAEGEVPSRKQ